MAPRTPESGGLQGKCVRSLYPASVYELRVVAMSALGPSPPSQSVLLTSAGVPRSARPPLFLGSVLLTSAGAPPSAPPPVFLIDSDPVSLNVGWTLPDLCNGAPVSAFTLEAVKHEQSALVYEGPSLSRYSSYS
ncbi:hypothetical protein T484DRAFT_1826731 [Baffinella frigidus]|nr:hypothetical protein T484DRAFT_1826731 [Cryptophyta sp. CCMP2293]